MKSLFRKALLPQLDSLAGVSDEVHSSKSAALHQHRQHGGGDTSSSTAVTDSLGMLGSMGSVETSTFRRRSNTNENNRAARMQIGSSSTGILQSLGGNTTFTKKSPSSKPTGRDAPTGLMGRYMGRINGKRISEPTGDSLSSLGGGTTTSRSISRRDTPDCMDILSSLENLSLQSVPAGRRQRSNKATTMAAAATITTNPFTQSRASQPPPPCHAVGDSLSQLNAPAAPSSHNNHGSHGLVGFAMGSSKQRELRVATRQPTVDRQASRPWSRTQPPPKATRHYESSSSSEGLGSLVRDSNRSVPAASHRVQASSSSGGLGALVQVNSSTQSNFVRNPAAAANATAQPTARTKRQEDLARQQKQRDMQVAASAGLGAFAQSTESARAGNTMMMFVDDSPSPMHGDIPSFKLVPVQRTKRQEVLMRKQKEEEKKVLPVDGLGALAGLPTNAKPTRISQPPKVPTLTPKPPKKRPGRRPKMLSPSEPGPEPSNMGVAETKKPRGAFLSPLKRRSKRFATDLPKASPASNAVIKRRDEKKTPPKLHSAIKRVIMDRLPSLLNKHPALLPSAPAAPAIGTILEEQQDVSSSVPVTHVEFRTLDALSPIDKTEEVAYCSDAFADAMDTECDLSVGQALFAEKQQDSLGQPTSPVDTLFANAMDTECDLSVGQDSFAEKQQGSVEHHASPAANSIVSVVESDNHAAFGDSMDVELVEPSSAASKSCREAGADQAPSPQAAAMDCLASPQAVTMDFPLVKEDDGSAAGETRGDTDVSGARRSSRTKTETDRFGVYGPSNETDDTTTANDAPASKPTRCDAADEPPNRRRGRPTKTTPTTVESGGVDDGQHQVRRSARDRVGTDRFGTYAESMEDTAVTINTPTSVKLDPTVAIPKPSKPKSTGLDPVRPIRERAEPSRFGKYADSYADEEEALLPPRALPPMPDVASKKSSHGFRVIERKLPFVKKSIPKPELTSDDDGGWTPVAIQSLRDAHGKVDSLSGTFWIDVAERIEDKSAMECRDKWFSLVQTPDVRRAKKKKAVAKTPASEYMDEDDIFNSTPMREDTRENGAAKRSSPMFMDFGSAIKVDTGKVNAFVSSEDDDDIAPLEFRPKAGFKAYLQGMRRDASRNQKDNKKKKPQGASMRGPKSLSEAVYEQDLDMNARLTPGGTLKMKSMTNADDDDFWGELYGGDGEEEIDSFQ